MIEVKIAIPPHEYFQLRNDLEDSFNECAIPVVMSADTVIRTWASIEFCEWFEKQGEEVNHYIGWGEIANMGQDYTTLAAVPHEYVDEDHQPYVVMLFSDDDEADLIPRRAEADSRRGFPSG